MPRFFQLPFQSEAISRNPDLTMDSSSYYCAEWRGKGCGWYTLGMNGERNLTMTHGEDLMVQIPSDRCSNKHFLLDITGRDNEMLVMVSGDGTIEYAEGYNPDKAARLFWKALAACCPFGTEKEWEHFQAKQMDEMGNRLEWRSEHDDRR